MIVVDTNIIVSGFRSRNGAAFRVLRGMVSGEIAFAISPALVLEYEDVLKRPETLGTYPAIGPAQIDVVLDALCKQGKRSLPWFRFRPFLHDPKDDHVIECALAANVRTIVTTDNGFQNPALRAFGIEQISARDLLARLG